jgi:outer membrane lipoprotein carrier protein
MPSAEGIAWASATPRSREAGFESIRLGFDAQGLVALELHDNFGQRTQIRLLQVERNRTLPADLFAFTPPKGADVIGE